MFVIDAGSDTVGLQKHLDAVFSGKTLPEIRAETAEEFGGMTRAEMHERRMAGHGVASRF